MTNRMKMVRFTKDMAPHKAGETRVIPLEEAERMIEAKEATPEQSVFDTIGDSRPKRYSTRPNLTNLADGDRVISRTRTQRGAP